VTGKYRYQLRFLPRGDFSGKYRSQRFYPEISEALKKEPDFTPESGPVDFSGSKGTIVHMNYHEGCDVHMNIDDMAMAIQAGESEKIPALWEAVKRLLFKKCGGYYDNHAGRCKAAGAEPDDLVQEAFFALLDAVEAHDPASGFQFTAYLNFPLQNRLNTLTRLRTPAQMKDPLCQADRLDRPVPGVEDLTVGDTVPDPAAQAALEQVECRLYNVELHDALDKAMSQLTSQQRETIEAHYYRGRQLLELLQEKRTLGGCLIT
jgi:RNA polymerase sigma factor (sigma-70 family)